MIGDSGHISHCLFHSLCIGLKHSNMGRKSAHNFRGLMHVPAVAMKMLPLFAILLVFPALVLSGCSSSPGSVVTPVQPAPPASVSMSITPASVMPGQSATLTWSTSNASNCTAGGAWSGSPALSGSTTVQLLGATAQTYKLTCSGTGLPGEKTVTLNAGSEQGACATHSAVRARAGKRTAQRRKLAGVHS